jgi:hypothetical protein
VLKGVTKMATETTTSMESLDVLESLIVKYGSEWDANQLTEEEKRLVIKSEVTQNQKKGEK